MSGIRIAAKVELPIEMVGESTAILAKKGAGKSNTGKVIVEETLDHGGIQVVVFDPIGHWWSLRAGADGKPRGGYPVAVFGGMHGDLPLEETAGKLLAQTAVESGQCPLPRRARVIEMVRILVDAGATPLSAVRAATVLKDGGSISAAWEEIEIAEVADFDAQLLVAHLSRELERVLMRVRS